MASQLSNVEEVFLLALEKAPAERSAFLEATCADSKLRARVEALLKAHDSAGDFLDVAAIRPSPLADTKKNRSSVSDTTCSPESLEFLASCDTPNRLGMLAHYEILDVLGRGGMATVLRSLDVKLNRVIAIKVMAPQLAADAMARQRFHREAQAAAAISHDHVVAIHAVDEWKGLPFLVMECVSGRSLQQRIDDSGALQLIQILRIGFQIASGLAAAHAHGLIHRDIKPANILLENGIERVKITDFGLARSIDDVRITQVGAVYGTPQYMSPEQAQGERVDQRSDLFSLGSVLYAMCTGRPPFRGDTGLSVLKRVCEDAPRPIREVNPNIPAALTEIVDKLMAKNPDARYQSAGEVAELLGRFLAHLQHDPLTPFQSQVQPQPLTMREERPDEDGDTSGQPEHRAARSKPRWPLFVGAAVLLAGVAVPAVLEGIGITKRTSLAEPKMTSINQEADLAPNTSPTLRGGSTTHPPGAANRPVKVFVLAGDATMGGRAQVALLKYQADQAKTKTQFQHLIHDGGWAVREDVWVKNRQQEGNLTVGFGHEAGRFGPELEFGNVVGDYFDEQVLLIKTCTAKLGDWYAGGGTLYGDFRPPSAGPPSEAILESLRLELRRTKPGFTPGDLTRRCGNLYRDMLTEVWQTLANIREHFPTYRGQGFEFAGFVWFQGWYDLCNPHLTGDHTELLAHLIRDVRTDFKTPNLPIVIGQMGINLDDPLKKHGMKFRAQQAAVAQLPEFKGNVKLVATDPFWDHEAHAVFKKGWRENRDEWDKVGSDYAFLYLGSPKTFCAIGKAFGEAMIELLRSRAKN